MRQLMRCSIIIALHTAIALGSKGDPLVSPSQARFLADAKAAAIYASFHAETQLLQAFDTALFKTELALQGSGGRALLKKPATELLEDVKDALKSVEWLFTFGLDPASAKLHPGQPAWSLDGIEEAGHIPTLWTLKVEGKAEALPQAQWRLVDAGETGLYRQQEFAKPADPTPREAANRPNYVSGNLVGFDAGIFEFGFYSPVYRQSALRDRSVIIGLDSGGWASVCNASVHTSWHWLHHVLDCDAIFAGGNKSVIFGTVDNFLHSFYANSQTFGIVGETLARRVYQLLVPGATMHPLEDNMYIEAAFLGPARMEDMKLFVASFPDVFGTPEAEKLKAFCKKHGLPLAWAMGGGRLRADLDMSHKKYWLPDDPFMQWPVNGDRLLDPSSWTSVNLEAPDGQAELWAVTEAEVVKVRQSNGANMSAQAFSSWWSSLKVAGGTAHGLRGGKACLDKLDLCFATSGDNKTAGQCLCRKDPSALEAETVLV